MEQLELSLAYYCTCCSVVTVPFDDMYCDGCCEEICDYLMAGWYPELIKEV